jgi:hypothetical protein
LTTFLPNENNFKKEADAIIDIVSRTKELFTEGWEYYSCQQYFSLEQELVDFLYKKEVEEKQETLVMTGYELAERFIDRLEDAGFNPWMFNEGRATKEDSFNLTKRQCLALGMNEYEFNARKQK